MGGNTRPFRSAVLPWQWRRWPRTPRRGSVATPGWSAWGRGWSTDPRERYGLAIGTLSRGPESPAKSAFVAQLIETYREPELFAQAWGISLASWDELQSAGLALPPANLGNPAVIRDLAAFTRRFAETYFRAVAEALHRHDPNHLYLGSRFAWRTPEAVEACGLWCDVVSFNLYQRALANGHGEWARFHAVGKPALIGEFHFGSTDRGLFWEGLVDLHWRQRAQRVYPSGSTPETGAPQGGSQFSEFCSAAIFGR